MWYEFADGSNPYIAWKVETDWRMIRKYEVEQSGALGFTVYGKRNFKPTYQNCKALLRDTAIEWQSNFGRCAYSWGELAKWQDFFETYGKRYGLLREFRENGIC